MECGLLGADLDNGQIVRSSTWRQSYSDKRQIYSEDELIDAYLKGKDEGLKSAKADFVASFSRDLKRAFAEAEYMLSLVQSNGIAPACVYLRITYPTPFSAEALYPVPLKQYVSQTMLETYELAGRREGEIREEDFDLTFRFAPLTEKTSHKLIVSDGFNFYHVQEQGLETTQSCPTQ